MTNALILVFVLLLLLATAGGYYLGRYQAALVDKIRTLEGQVREPKPVEKPTVTMGAYQKPPVTSTDSKRSAGLVEPKTPQLLEWETQIATEKEILGR